MRGTLAHDPVAGARGQAHAPAHAHAVRPRQQRLAVRVDQPVELILDLKERIAVDKALNRLRRAHGAPPRPHRHGAKPALAGALQDHQRDPGVGGPGAQHRQHAFAHLEVQSVELTRPIERDHADAPAVAGGEFFE